MQLKIEDMFDPRGKERMLRRIKALTPESKALWGKMEVGQMLAHCNVAYEIVHEPGKHTVPGFMGKFFAKLFAKSVVIGDKPYPKTVPLHPCL
jgi:hypothetical protein